MDAYGKEIVVIETVGVGQVELEVMDLSDTVVLVNVPGLGDSIQTLKAGIMEIADVFVVNQADRPGADDSVRDLRLMLDERGNTGWARPVLKTVATTGEGIAELSEAVRRHREYLKQERLWEEKRQKRNRRRLMGELEAIFVALITDHLQNDPSAKVLREQVEAGREDPYSAAQKIMQHFLKAPRTGG
jgi:LAO/AO transport system kinase